MRNSILTIVLTALVLGPLSASFAYAHGPDGRWRQDGPHWNGGPRGDDGPRWERGRGGQRWDEGPGRGWGHHEGRRDDFRWRGYDFRRGYAIPGPFRGDRYWVRDWHGYGLPSPPPGHQWRSIDGNYVLIAVATGVITSILLNNVLR